MSTTTHNGWTNYETWCVNLWLTNEPESDESLRMLAQLNASNYHRSDALKNWVMDMAAIDEASMFTDLLQAALINVNWSEIIENHENDD